jgi:PucR C-terminal helix-turn-helix domain/GGDEF-like domain
VNPDPAILALREALEHRLDDLVDEAAEMIVAEVPAYRDADGQLRGDIRAHIRSHLRANLASFGADRDITREDLLFVRPHAARRAAKRVSVAEFVQAFYVGERVLWDAALSLAHDDESRRAALVLASHLPRYFEVATTHAAEVYLETQEQLATTGEQIRRDLLEDLLAGRALEPGPRLESARAAGLRDQTSCLVICATPCVSPADEHLLRSAAAALSRTSASRQALAVVRQDEIVIVSPAANPPPESFGRRLADVQRRLADGGLPLAVGVSSVISKLGQIPDAYREANAARIAIGSGPGVVSLTGMSAFEYLTLHADATASRLIAPAIQAFVSQDAEDGGPLIATLRAYVASDLNARRAAESLHVHVNTAHYRLGRIAERTGCDLRNFGDLIEILIAARLADAAARSGHAG